MLLTLSDIWAAVFNLFLKSVPPHPCFMMFLPSQDSFKISSLLLAALLASPDTAMAFSPGSLPPPKKILFNNFKRFWQEEEKHMCVQPSFNT